MHAKLVSNVSIVTRPGANLPVHEASFATEHSHIQAQKRRTLKFASQILLAASISRWLQSS